MYVITTKGNAYLLEKGKPLKDCPKRYLKNGIESVPALTNNYNNGLMTIYEVYGNDNITLRYSIYVDGCFHPYYGKLYKVYQVPYDTLIPSEFTGDSLKRREIADIEFCNIKE